MYKIFVEAKNLICSDGHVWLWKSESLDGVRHFATQEDAQKYIDLLHQLSREKGWKEESYSIGTEDDFLAAAKKHEADKKANEVKAYCKHADALIERRRLEIKALDGLIQVCRQFDGKVLNKRFHDAVKEATGFYNSFNQILTVTRWSITAAIIAATTDRISTLGPTGATASTVTPVRRRTWIRTSGGGTLANVWKPRRPFRL